MGIINDSNRQIEGYFGKVIGSFVCLEDGEYKLKAVIYNEIENDREVIDCSNKAEIVPDCKKEYLLALHNKNAVKYPTVGQEITVVRGKQYPHGTKGIVQYHRKNAKMVKFHINYNPTDHWIDLSDVTWEGK